MTAKLRRNPGFTQTKPRPVSRDRRLAGRDGFTLVEVLVAFTVLAVLTVAVQRAVMTAVGGTARANARIGAELVARTLISAPLAQGPEAARAQSGRMNGYPWRVRFETVDLPFSTRLTAEGKTPEWTPLRMIAQVGSDTGDRPLVTLETIRLVKTAAQ